LTAACDAATAQTEAGRQSQAACGSDEILTLNPGIDAACCFNRQI
jgi:hypothetical protein